MAGAEELILRAKKAADNACIVAELASLRTAMNAPLRAPTGVGRCSTRERWRRAYTVRYLLDDERERRQLKLAAVQGKLRRATLLRAEQRERGAAASLALRERARHGGSATSSGTRRPRPSRTRGRRAREKG